MTPNARDKELAEEAALEWAEAMHAYARLGPARLPDLATIIALALTKQREEFENNSAAKHWHGLYRKECQERDRAVAETVERAAQICDERFTVIESDMSGDREYFYLDELENAAKAIRDLAPKVEKEERK